MNPVFSLGWRLADQSWRQSVIGRDPCSRPREVWESGVKKTKGQRGGGWPRPGTGDSPYNGSKRMGDGKKKDWGVDKTKKGKRVSLGQISDRVYQGERGYLRLLSLKTKADCQAGAGSSERRRRAT